MDRTSGGATPGPGGPVPGAPRRVRQVPALLVLAVLALGLVLTLLGAWRVGTTTVGAALLLAAGLRLTLPVRQAGWLVVRGRGADAAVLLGLGLATVALAGSVPG